MKLLVFDKINDKLNFLHQKKIFLTPFLKRLLYNKLIQPHFDYDCSARYADLRLKDTLKAFDDFKKKQKSV